MNDRTQNALKKINDVLENQTVVHNDVNFTTNEAIHMILVRLINLETSRDDETVSIVPNESVEGEKSAHSEEDDKIVPTKKIWVASKESRS